MPTYGALGIGGVVAFVVGALMLIDSDVPGFGVPLSLIGALALVSARLRLRRSPAWRRKARRRPVVSGARALIGAAARCSTFAAARAGPRVARRALARARRDARCAPASACASIARRGPRRSRSAPTEAHDKERER